MKRCENILILFCAFISKVTCENSLGNDLKYIYNNMRKSGSEYNILEYDYKQYNEDLDLNITQLIKKTEYPVEEYTIITPDGYKLKIFRIPGKGPVIFLLHGLFSSADDWVTAGIKSGMAFLLAAQGYDVWMGNARGNKHSRENIHIDPSNKNFWDFSFHEIGIYDVPSMIDFILKKSNDTSLIYIGHSQGTTAFYIMCSLRPEYNNKIKLMVSLSPIAWLSHIKSPIKLFKPFITEADVILKFLGIYELFQDNITLRLLLKVLCGTMSSAFIVCQHINFILCGFSYEQTNFPRLPVIYNHFPTSVSTKQIIHYGQILQSGYFRQYDYGILNFEKYGSVIPPSYPIENVKAPVALFYSEGDWLSSVTDVENLRSKLPRVVDFYKIQDKHFNHIDFTYAKDSHKLLLPNILRLIKLFK